MSIPLEKRKFILDDKTSSERISKQGGDCHICCSKLEIGNDVLIKTLCPLLYA